MNKTLVSAFAILATASAFAEAVAFPDKLGDHDISNPEAWGGEIPTGDVKTTVKGVTYNANYGDITFPGQFGINAGPETFDFTATPNRKVNVEKYLNINVGSRRFEFLGGSWTFVKTIRVGTGSTATRDGNTVVYSNVVVTCPNPEVYGSNNKLVFTGGATLNVDSAVAFPFDGGYSGNEFLVSDKATFESQYAGSSPSFALNGSRNSLTVSDGTVTLGKNLVFNDGSSFAKVVVQDGGSLSAKAIMLNGTDGELSVLNGTLTCTSYSITLAGERNTMRLQGKDTVVSVKSPYETLFDSGNGHKVLVSDGAKWGYAGSKGIYYLTKSDAGASSNRVVVASNAELDLAGKQFWIGYTNDCGHCVSILDGAKLTASSVSIGSYDNSLVVTNGIVNLSGTAYLGKSLNSAETVNSGARVEIAGAKAKLTTGKVDVYNESILHFAVPAEGYDQVPWTAEKLTVRSGCAITVDADAFQTTLNDTTSVVLMTWTADDAAVNANVLAAANAELAPKKMKLIFDKDNKQLVLRVRSLKPGLTIILR